MKRTGWIPLLAIALALAGCVERRLTITSEPTGSLATVNSKEVGRTPVTVPFTWYGDYDVLLRYDEGDQHYQTLKTHYNVTVPWYEFPPLDLFSEMAPWTYHVDANAHFTMQKATPVSDEQLLKQSDALRERALQGDAK
jgi:hypothetical protein